MLSSRRLLPVVVGAEVLSSPEFKSSSRHTLITNISSVAIVCASSSDGGAVVDGAGKFPARISRCIASTAAWCSKCVIQATI